MSETTEPAAGLEARYAALRQAARSEGGDPGDVLEAVFTELEGAIDLLRAVAPVRRDDPLGTPADAERGLLRAVFQDAPVPQFLVARDGTVVDRYAPQTEPAALVGDIEAQLAIQAD